MSRSTDPFENWHNGFQRIVARELAGQPVPPEWERRLDELDVTCREIEDSRPWRLSVTQSPLCAAPRRAELGGR